MACVSSPEELQRTILQERLRQVEERLERDMRARGFDPEQSENVALTGSLAKLYAERERLREELESLKKPEKPQVL
jgi:hypothetical protein